MHARAYSFGSTWVGYSKASGSLAVRSQKAKRTDNPRTGRAKTDKPGSQDPRRLGVPMAVAAGDSGASGAFGRAFIPAGLLVSSL